MGHFVAFHFSYQNVVVKSSLGYKMRYFCVKTLKTFVEGNLFQLFLLYLHHKYYEYGSKEVESVEGRYGREGSVKYMVVGKVRSQSGDCL